MGTGRAWSEASSFPPDKTGKNCDFAQVLKRSICLEQNTQAWCDNCEKYQPTVSGRLPWARVLPRGRLGCGLTQDRRGQHQRPEISSGWEEHQLEEAAPGLNCSRPGFFPCGPPAIPVVSSSQIQTRNIRHLPDILVINCEVNSLKEADFWRMQAEVRT